MQGIIFNTQSEFDTLEALLHSHVQANVAEYNATKWCESIVGTDGKFLMVGVNDPRLSSFDFTGYTIETLSQAQKDNFYPPETAEE